MAVRTGGKRNARPRSSSNVVPGMALIAVAIVIAAVIISRSRKPEAQPVQQAFVAQYDTVDLPVPTRSVPAGTRVRDVKFKMVSFPEHQIPPGALRDVSPILDAVASTALPANLPLFAENFNATSGMTNPVIESIPNGMRAISVRVDATSAVEGWARPGAIVDVLLVQDTQSTVVAEKVKILSAERKVRPEDGTTPNVPSTMTLLVTQEQALAISTAIPRGSISLLLRNFEDKEAIRARQTNIKQVVTGSRTTTGKGVSGYFTTKDGKKEQKFVLTDGEWVASEVKPKGFGKVMKNEKN